MDPRSRRTRHPPASLPIRTREYLAVAEYIDWFNHRRLHGEIGLVPVEFEEQYYRHNPVATTVAASVQSLY